MDSSLPISGNWLVNTIAVATGTCLCGRLPIREHFGEYGVMQEGYLWSVRISLSGSLLDRMIRVVVVFIGVFCGILTNRMTSSFWHPLKPGLSLGRLYPPPVSETRCGENIA